MNLYHEWLKRKFSTLELGFNKKRFEKDIEGQDIEAYKTFVVPLDNSNLYLLMRNYLVTPNQEKIIASDNEEETKDS